MPGSPGLPSPNAWGRTAGAPGAWREGARQGGCLGRRPPAELFEELEFPEAVGNELTLRRAFGVLLDKVLDRTEREARFVRKAALSARLVGGGSWRRTVTMRDPTAERDRLRQALGPKLAELPAPVVSLRIELVELTDSRASSSSSSRRPGRSCRRGSRGLRQVRAAPARVGGIGRRGCSVVADPEARGRCMPYGTTVQSRARRSSSRPAKARGSSTGRGWHSSGRSGGSSTAGGPGARQRRYFEIVLESGQNVVVFRDEERGGWFSQRGASRS